MRLLPWLFAGMFLLVSSPTKAQVFGENQTPNYATQHRTKKIVPRHHGTVLGGRPSGCPHAFCGCGASLYLFGKIRAELNLAANWLRFPRSAPAPRMAAARRGHVMVLVEPRGGDKWLVYDANSGGGLIRLHERSIAGYQVVNPFG